ncbi:MAG: hypothetical protein AAF799_12795 [Myxococcota bacterium]
MSVLGRHTAFAATVVLGGCVVPVIVGDGPDESTGGATGTGSMGSPSGDSSSDASSSGTTTGGGLDDDSTGTTDGSSAETGSAVGSVCDPQPEGISVWFIVEDTGTTEPAFEPWERDVACTVGQIQPKTGGQAIVLQCPDDEQFTIELSTFDSVPSLPLAAEDPVRLRMAYAPGIDSVGARHIAISEPGEGGALLVGLYTIGNPEYVDQVADWYAPLSFSRVDDVCELEPYEPPEEPDDTSFIARPCSYQTQRQAYDFVLDGGDPQRVFDQRREPVGNYDVWVEGARRLFPQEEECGGPDAFSDWTNLLIVGNR